MWSRRQLDAADLRLAYVALACAGAEELLVDDVGVLAMALDAAVGAIAKRLAHVPGRVGNRALDGVAQLQLAPHVELAPHVRPLDGGAPMARDPLGGMTPVGDELGLAVLAAVDVALGSTGGCRMATSARGARRPAESAWPQRPAAPA